jgi:DNA-binding LytR/AlgR family response regulator
MHLTVVVIEDEPIIAADLVDMLEKATVSIKVAARLSSVQEGMAYFKNHPLVDLILSDIRLGDGLSFDIFLVAKPTCPVVFCTAHDEYMLTAFKSNGIDYLLKPIDQKSLNDTLERFQSVFMKRRHDGNFPEQLQRLIDLHHGERTPKSLLLHEGEFIIPVRYENVLLAYIHEGKTHICTREHKTHVIPETLEQLEAKFAKTHFRINRQYLLHRDAVDSVANYFSRKLLVSPPFEHPDKLLVSKANVPAFLTWLKG